MLEVNCALKSKYRACLGECLFGLVRRGNVRVVIHASIELMAFYEVLEVFHGQVDSQQLSIERACLVRC